jgi:YidC/Oxa1 family membrane protein insertase
MLRVDLRYDICPNINHVEDIGKVAAKTCGESPESSFLFIPDLTGRATGLVLVTLIILYVGSQLVSTLLMSATADKNQRMIFIALPFLFVAFIWQFPAGLLVYWITTNVWTIVQQSIIKKRLGPLREQVAAAAKEAKEKEKAEEAAQGKPAQGKGKGGGGGRALGKLSPSAAVAAGEGATAKGGGGTNGPPPSPPRKKKKRSGRRR